MAERLAWPLFAFLSVSALARADVELPDQMVSCSEISEDICETTSLLQLSLVFSETSLLGQHKPLQKRSTGRKWALPAATFSTLQSAMATRKQRDLQLLATKLVAADLNRSWRLMRRWEEGEFEEATRSLEAADLEDFNRSLDISEAELLKTWDPCDEGQQKQTAAALNLMGKYLPRRVCQEEYSAAVVANDALLGIGQNGDLNCENEFIRTAAKDSERSLADCFGLKVIPPNLGDFDLYLLSPLQTNLIVAILFVFVIGNFYYGWSAGNKDKQSCPAWVVLMLVVSYLCFAVGFFVNNTAWFMTARMKNGIMTVLTFDFQTFERKAMSENPYNIIQTVIGYGGYRAIAGWGFLILVVGDPLLKLVLVVLTEVYRYSESTVGFARKCIIFVVVTAKWSACLHLFILTFHCQFLAMDVGQVDLETSTVLDIGWACFTLFVITNVISALSISIPPLSLQQKERSIDGISDRYKVLLLVITLTYAAAYFRLLGFGCAKPMFSLDLKKYATLLEELTPKAREALGKSMTLVNCMWWLLNRFLHSGQLIPLLAFLVVFIFVILLPLADMSVMTLCAFHAYQGDNATFSYWLNVSRLTRHSAMADVLILGALLSHLGNYLSLETAVPAIVAAELIRYFTVYFLIEGVAMYIELPDDTPTPQNKEEVPTESRPSGRMLTT